MNQTTNQTFGVQRQNNNRHLQRPQNLGRQAARPQNTPNLFTDTFTAIQQNNDLVEGSNPFIRTQGVEISTQSTQLSRVGILFNINKVTHNNFFKANLYDIVL
ncbi:hypothetical protein F8M41_007906 [Gigaspora margarita]|uniref:Uncharacterized protein n=1 Tax=Gigaspora margarita TaxID=4874 RepID=A0A8H4A2R7_GIGMA|nr:hypothetical protein F8M41_007906 [Gigaspora margarita]